MLRKKLPAFIFGAIIDVYSRQKLVHCLSAIDQNSSPLITWMINALWEREGGDERGRESERERERGNVGGTFLNVELTRQTWQKLCQHFRTKKLSLIFCLTTWLCYATHTRTRTLWHGLSQSLTPTFSFSLSLYLSFSPQPKSHGKKYRPLDH